MLWSTDLRSVPSSVLSPVIVCELVTITVSGPVNRGILMDPVDLIVELIHGIDIHGDLLHLKCSNCGKSNSRLYRHFCNTGHIYIYIYGCDFERA